MVGYERGVLDAVLAFGVESIRPSPEKPWGYAFD
jgi:hypothetical protein